MSKGVIVALFLFCVSIIAGTEITGSRVLLAGNYSFSWTLDENSQTISHTVTVKTIRTWIGIGWTQDRSAVMANTTMAVVTFDSVTGEASIACYWDDGRGKVPSRMPLCYATLSNVKIDEQTHETTITIGRNLKMDKGTELFNVPIVDGPLSVVAQCGHTALFDTQNMLRDSVTVNYWDPQVVLPKFSNSSIVFGESIMNDNYRMYWWINIYRNTISFQLVAKTNGWFGMAIAPSPTIVGAAITVCSLGDDNVLTLDNWYAVQDRTRPSQGPFKFATAVASHFNNVEKKSSCTFMRPLEAQDAQHDRPIVNATVHILWAFGDTKELGDHGKNRGSAELNLFGNFIQPPGKSTVLKTVLKWVHGVLMIIAWGVCSSVGMYFSSYAKRKMPVWWLRWHVIVFVVCLLCTIVGYVVILWRERWRFALHYPHAFIGFIIIVASLLQPILGFAAHFCYKASRRGTPLFPDKAHWYIGRVLWLAGLANCYLGLEVAKADLWLKMTFFFWVLFLIAIFVFNSNSSETTRPIILSSNISNNYGNISNNEERNTSNEYPNESNPLIQKK